MLSRQRSFVITADSPLHGTCDTRKESASLPHLETVLLTIHASIQRTARRSIRRRTNGSSPRCGFSRTFGSSFEDTIISSINWIMRTDRSQFVSANEQFVLFGNSPETWPVAHYDQFMNALVDYWKNWS